MTAMVRRLFGDCHAVISVELALVASVLLVPLVTGATDAGQLLVVRGQLDQVLHEALFYAYANSGSVTAANVQTYAAQAYGTGTAPTVTATITPYCIAPAIGYPATGTPAQPSNGVCGNSSQSVQNYLSVAASATVTLSFTVPWVARTRTLTVSGKARIS